MEAEDILSKLAKKEPGQALFVDAAVAEKWKGACYGWRNAPRYSQSQLSKRCLPSQSAWKRSRGCSRSPPRHGWRLATTVKSRDW